jgi:hypothetical protein
MACTDSRDRGLVGLVLGQAVDGVAHDQRRLGRVEDDDGLALPRAADLFHAPAVVRVNSSMFLRVPGPAERLDTVATISA